jgi:hypothetical protein
MLQLRLVCRVAKRWNHWIIVPELWHSVSRDKEIDGDYAEDAS